MIMRMLTGIQGTGLGQFHLGNYCGAIYPIKKAIESGVISKEEIFIFIADLHSMTVHSENLGEKSFNMIKSLMCFDISNNLYIQSQIPVVCEGLWLLSQFTTTGEMNRMTQFKDKSKVAGSNLGLYTYPVLMAADILLMGATHVPVGQDQTQHLEIVKNIGIKVNQRAKKKIFNIPKMYTFGKAIRIMSLNDITKKMSKSMPEGCLFINDNEEVIKKKISRAQTDSGLFPSTMEDLESRPAPKNLALIYSIISDIPLEKIIEEFQNTQWSYFKNKLIELIWAFNKKYMEDFYNINDEEIVQLLEKNKNVINNTMRKYIEELYGIFL